MKTKFKKGFTLIEILIASTIFAIIMVMATAVFSMTASYNTKISESRNVMNDARSAMMQISDDIRLSNGGATVTAGQNTVAVKDIFLIRLDNAESTRSQIIFQNYRDPSTVITYVSAEKFYALGIIQKNKDRIIIYRQGVDGKSPDLTRIEIPVVGDAGWAGTIDVSRIDGTKLNGGGTSLVARFGGDMLASSARVQHAFANIWIRARSINYDTLQPSNRSQIELKSSVESRDYN